MICGNGTRFNRLRAEALLRASGAMPAGAGDMMLDGRLWETAIEPVERMLDGR